MTKDGIDELCSKVEKCYHIFSKKWMGLIIHTLMANPQRFSEIHSRIPDLSKRMLNERIKELEHNGIIVRNVITSSPLKIEYSLTAKGNELGFALQQVELWAAKWL
ncbi:winged helix-turn-helix transcriptional regulator [Paenibacillus pini]|uniref:Transcriptional regulator n=1 Tax=Paenibacillus pini JCM 16418 TaxID=1236976 RepID=W7YSW5_9BACL|nr:helix-turn-helix domain-containing protein [Paenibacillus pini]GAF07721.1 transcriptional regulator [Paenibacillus pini JCM 16418]